MRTVEAYSKAGVDTDNEEAGLQLLIERVRSTWPASGGTGSVMLPIGYYANVIDVGGQGIAITTDGVGSKVVVAELMERYDTVGIDCVAMNVNDLICVGARPLSLVDYIAVQEANPRLLDELAKGLCTGAAQANVSITGGEIAQLPDVIKHHHKPGFGFDLAATAIGVVPLDRILVGHELRPGDALIGVASNGIHSNGLTLARQVLLEDHGLTVDSHFDGIDGSLGEELLRPTHIYVREAVELLESGLPIKAIAHITSDGFLNLLRVPAAVGYDIETLPDVPAIFGVIQKLGQVPAEEMFRVFNMGTGLCVACAPEATAEVVRIVASHGKQALRIGTVTDDPQRRVLVRPANLVGQGKTFYRA